MGCASQGQRPCCTAGKGATQTPKGGLASAGRQGPLCASWAWDIGDGDCPQLWGAKHREGKLRACSPRCTLSCPVAPTAAREGEK